MTGNREDEATETTASKPPVAVDHAENGASGAGGWDTEPPAAGPEKITIDPSGRDHEQRDRRVVARGAQRGELNEGLIIQALLMIAKDLERGNRAGCIEKSED